MVMNQSSRLPKGDTLYGSFLFDPKQVCEPPCPLIKHSGKLPCGNRLAKIILHTEQIGPGRRLPVAKKIAAIFRPCWLLLAGFHFGPAKKLSVAQSGKKFVR